eukprot:CAMPEP_0197655444 /NCGR_PEP_ID=MMETSP1338-20131121/39456_1 /TAXON_ID=43686 ORGANISM="Pelagodinium beii, Strain RCC1491" /NCGR_SAMPLE_ID=MMETSP1338 /ASSEMBLY_ACC=CAM_ASM_000754 /LENGTH=352 /DNA_ID=CAMNT_0043231093 /DNA_START=53 /DNA_END=1111 /DNA_ORIENTATION=-
MKSFARAFAAAALLGKDALALKTDGSTESSKAYLQLPELSDVFAKLQQTQDSMNAKIEGVEKQLAVEKNNTQTLLSAKRLDLDKKLVEEQKKTNSLTKENAGLKHDIAELGKSNAEKLQKIQASNASNLVLRARIATLKSTMADDEQSLEASLDNSSDARVADILDGTSDSNNTASEGEDDKNDDDKKPLSFLAVSRHLRGAKDGEDEESTEDSSEETTEDTDASATPAPVNANSTPQEPQVDAVANLMAQGLKQLKDQTTQEEAQIEKAFEEKMSVCKKQTEAAQKEQESLKLTISQMKKRELQLVSAQQELDKAQVLMKESVTKQTAFFLKEYNQLKVLDSKSEVQPKAA